MTIRTFGALILILQTLLSACHSNENGNASSKLNRFYESARRRDADQSEKSYLGKIEQCAGFFVRNSKGLNLFMTARHCLNFNSRAWCASKHFVTDELTKVNYSCNKILAENSSTDGVLLQLKGTRTGATLRLAGFLAASGTPLKLIGYPGDLIGLGKPKTTENCWIQDAISPNPYPSHAFLHDLTYSHNCSTYGGNSGGPMIIEGTDVVVGQPYSYEAGNYKKYPFTENLIHGAAIFNITSPFKSKLESLGVEHVNEQPEFKTGDYLPAARYLTDDIQSFPCGLLVVPLYRTGVSLAGIKIFDGCLVGDAVEFICDKDASNCEVDGKRITAIDNNSFSYSSEDMHVFQFRREGR